MQKINKKPRVGHILDHMEDLDRRVMMRMSRMRKSGVPRWNSCGDIISVTSVLKMIWTGDLIGIDRIWVRWRRITCGFSGYDDIWRMYSLLDFFSGLGLETGHVQVTWTGDTAWLEWASAELDRMLPSDLDSSRWDLNLPPRLNSTDSQLILQYSDESNVQDARIADIPSWLIYLGIFKKFSFRLLLSFSYLN